MEVNRAGAVVLTDPVASNILLSSYFQDPLQDPPQDREGFDGKDAEMDTTKLSTKGQVIIPKDVRTAVRWRPGQELEVRLTKEGVLLKPRSPFPETRIEDVAGCLWRPGMKAKSLKEISRLSAKAIREAWNDGSR